MDVSSLEATIQPTIGTIGTRKEENLTNRLSLNQRKKIEEEKNFNLFLHQICVVLKESDMTDLI